MYQPTRLFLDFKSLRLVSLLVFSVLAIVAIAGPAVAQSGRKVTKRTEPVNPTPTAPEPVEEPEPPLPAREQLPQITMLVVGDNNRFNLPTGFAEYVVKNCVARLRQSNRLSIGVGKEVSRKQATDQAKSESEKFVVWITVESQRSDLNQPRLDDISVDYVVFSPGTAKIKTQGRVYLRPYRPGIGIGGVGVPLPTAPGVNQIEQPLQQAGIETADRIMSSFNIGIVGQRPF
jgi:hypothetical protein